jgi:hypothetical protein
MPIAHIANLWSLVAHPTRAKEWSLDRKIGAVARAGFDGFTTALTPEHRRLAEKHELKHLLGFISTSEPAEFSRLIAEQKEGGAVHINVQLDDHDTPPAVAVKHWREMERAAEKIGGVVLSLEVHRDTCTETPEKTYEIAERYFSATGRLVKLNFDYSHLACVKHLNASNYAARLITHPELLQHSEQCHFRPFNGHHCQVPVTFRGALTPEVKDYLGFVREVMRVWKQGRGNATRTLFACPEMGPYPSGYNVTGFPPAWPDAVVLRGELEKAWRAAR